MSLIKRFHHASVLTSDLKVARAFYEGIFELKPSPLRPAMAYDGVWYEIGEQQIHLIALPNPDLGAERPEHGGRDRHTALLVEDLDEIIERLAKAQVNYSLSKSGRRAVFCRDPEGNGLELIESKD